MTQDKTTSTTEMRFAASVEDMRGRMKEAWGALTDDDIDRSQGQWDRMISTIRERTGESLETVTTKVNELIDRLQEAGAPSGGASDGR